jgi:hypothetical protein
MQWLVLSWALTVGWLPLDATGIVNPAVKNGITGVANYDAISTKFELQADAFNHFKVFGSIETRETFDTSPSAAGMFSPYESYFIAGAAFYAKGIEFRISHECDHGMENTDTFVPWVSSGSTTVSMKISGKTSF